MGRLYTLYYRKMISLAVLDPQYAKIGTEVEVIWGDKNDRKKNIRATVARYPYLDLVRNEHFDVETIPRVH
jgi:glycine cleavage system aminomethyltransferase T